jgi:hypothetical protein
MMTKTTIALAAALFFAVGTAAQASDFPGSHERQGEGFSFHTGPLGQHLGARQPGSWWASPSRAYGYVPRHEYIRHHRPVR